MTQDLRLTQLLEELVAWTKFAHRQSLHDALRAALRDRRQWRAYEATDGAKSQTEVAAASGLSQPAVSGLWAKWRRLGLATDNDGRAKHLARPSDLGIEEPE